MLVTMINLSRRGIAVKLASNLHLGGSRGSDRVWLKYINLLNSPSMVVWKVHGTAIAHRVPVYHVICRGNNRQVIFRSAPKPFLGSANEGR
jgi:hypothetical protein